MGFYCYSINLMQPPRLGWRIFAYMIWTESIENWLNNFSFFILFCSMGFYWVRAFFNLPIFSFLGRFSVIGANLSMLFLLISRGFVQNHFPLSNHATRKLIN